jgi:hypothetical protein
MINVVHSRRVAAAADPINLLFFFFHFYFESAQMVCNSQERTRGKGDPCTSKPTKPEPEPLSNGDTIAILLLGLQWHQRLKKKTFYLPFQLFFLPGSLCRIRTLPRY